MANTLDYFSTHPLRLKQDHSTVPLSTVRLSEQTRVCSLNLHPTAGAYIHYGGVELADKLVVLKPQLSKEEIDHLCGTWNASCGGTARQLLYYVWHIIVRELRHGNSGMVKKAFSDQKTDPEIVNALKMIMGSGSDYMKKVDEIDHKPVGAFVSAVEQHYRHGGWGHSFGGTKWADIAKVYLQYVTGVSSAMIASDRCWTLVHNTGPIFNKGMYFKLHDDNLGKVLNAQAKTSVFDMGDPSEFLTGKYSHPFSHSFTEFSKAALAAIRKVDPDYTLGAGATGSDDDSLQGIWKPNAKKLGPITFNHTCREIA